MYGDIVRQPRSGYVEHLKSLGESEDQEVATSTVDPGKHRVRYWYWAVGVVLLGVGLWGKEAALVICAVGVGYLYGGRVWTAGKDCIAAKLIAGCFRAIALFEKLQLQVAFRLQEIHQLATYTPINTGELELFSCLFTREFTLWKEFLDRRAPGIVAGMWGNTRVQRLDYLRRHTQALVISRKTGVFLLLRIWICVTIRCSGLISVLGNSEEGLEYAKEFLSQPASVGPAHSFELGELRKQQGLLLKALQADRDLQSELSRPQLLEAAELFNRLGESLESCIAQQEINAHYLAELLAGNQAGSFTVIGAKLVSCTPAAAAVVPVSLPEAKTVFETLAKGSDSDESDTAYVYEGTAQHEERIETGPQPEARSVRLSHKALAELKERMQQRPATKVKLVCSDGPLAAVPVEKPGVKEVQAESVSERTKEAARNVLQELLQRKGGTRSGNVLES